MTTWDTSGFPKNSASFTPVNESSTTFAAPQTKNSASFTAQSKTANDLTWDEATFTWDNANGTWNAQYANYLPQTKNSATFTPINKS